VHGTIESAFRVEWRPLDALAPVTAAWTALASRALEPNVFYEPFFARAAAPVFGKNVGAGLVWSRGGGTLLGFFPARIEARRHGLPLPILTGWTHAYGPLGVPLVDRDLAEPAIAAWLDHIAANPALPDLLLIPYLPLEQPFARAFDAVLARRGGEAVSFARHARALFAPDEPRAGYLERAIGHKKRKELRRLRKRLAERGVLMSAATGEAAAVRRALDDFLALEAAGWKGRARTAARGDEAIRSFLVTAVSDLAGEGKAQVERLLIDARAIAAAVVLRSGTTAWCWKIAYDETQARFSPGVQLVLDLTQRLIDEPRIARADSCATENHPMIDHIWRERLVVADRLVRIGPHGRARFALARSLEAARRAALGGAKALRDAIARR
jgi:hypothetical protein